MNLKERFLRIKALAETISEPYLVVKSVSTSDGGKEGVLSLVSREIAAQMLVDGKCGRANEEEEEEFYRLDREAHERQRSELLESRLRRELDFETLIGIRQGYQEK